MSNTMQDEIAIVGIAAQLPSGVSSTKDLDYTTFWDFLVKGEKAYEPLGNYLPDLAKLKPDVQNPAQGAFLKNPDGFDNISLGVSTRDARVIPYSARRVLDLSFQALLDSGIESRGCKIGCFMSGNRTLEGENAMDADGSFSWAPHAMANRISYALDLTGPSILLDTACSSSLNALHLAIASIQRGDCTAALVGAAQINRDPFEWTAYAQGGVLAADGMCRPMDDSAMGFGRGEGAVVIVLKPLKDAIRDRDHVYSVVLGSAINATGSQMPLNVPNGAAQQECIYEAYRRAGMDPKQADFVELHATGTLVGDPIEANATAEIFANGTSALFGSVKGNIGHLEVTAFLASLVKACLIFEHGVIPPTVNFSTPASRIDWGSYQATVPVEPTPLGCRSSSGRSVISLSSSGLGGTTGHVVLQAPPPPAEPISALWTAPVLFLVGGLSSNAVDLISQGILQFDVADSGALRECASTLSRRARQLPWRKYFTIPSSPRAPMQNATLIPNPTSPLVFVFSGQGPQHLEMGRQLFAEYPVFRNTVLELDEVYTRISGVSLMESTGLFALEPAAPTVTLPGFGWPVTITVSAIAMIQIALVDLLRSVGIVPDVMLGHSAGETAILYASGAGPKAMAMEIAIARGEAMTCTESTEVGMAMLGCNAARASELISRVTVSGGGILELSCFNAQDSVAVSGTAALLDALVALAIDEQIFSQRIRTLVPGHSSFMDRIKADYLARMDDIFARYPGPHAPRIPVYSTCRETKLVDVFTAEYFWDNCRNAVLFNKAVSDSLSSSSTSPVFLELSCHAVLSSSILAHAVPENCVLCPMRRISARQRQSVNVTEPETFLDTLGRLSLLGVNSLDLSGLYGQLSPSSLKSKLIEHPLVVRAIPPPKSVSRRLMRSMAPDGGPLSAANLRIVRNSHPDLAEHVINGEPIFPATGYIELLLEAGANYLWDVEFVSILSLASPAPIEVGLQRMDAAWAITTLASSREREHARGFMDRSAPPASSPVVDCESIFKRLSPLNFEDFYPSVKKLAAYGPRFQRVVRCHGGPAEVIAEIRGPTPEELASGYLLHPAITDACLHVMLHPEISKQYSADAMFLPSRLEHFVFHRREYSPGNWFSHIQLRQWTPDSRFYDIVITDSTGLALCELRNLVVRKITSGAPLTVDRRFDLIFQPVAVKSDIPIIPTTFPERGDMAEIQLLFKTLDSMAVEMIAKSLENDVVVGEEESRSRYLAFARGALERPREELHLSAETLETLRDHWPHHFEITRRIATVHESVFQTPQRAVDALYSDGLMAQFYTQSNQTSDVVSHAITAFSDVLDSLRKSGKRAIRMLEVGAGTGLFTFPLIEELKRNPDLLVEYTVTDISYALVSNLARNLAYASVIPKAYDISRDAGAQGIHAESYDIIVALHVLHAAPNVNACLASLQKLLVPGGCLFTVELDGTCYPNAPGSLWSDAVFGPFAEWFAWTDDRDHCSMAPARWRKLLQAVDFVNVQACVEGCDRGREFFFAAQKPLSYSIPAFGLDVDLSHVYVYEFGKEIELQRSLSDLDPTASLIVYLLALTGRDADAALGLCASLRKEISAWDIRLAIFESPCDLANPTPLLIRHMGALGEKENVVSFVGDGAAFVPRVVLSPPSSHQPDAVDDSSYLTVRVSHWAGISDVYDGFVGQVTGTHHLGEYVGGVVAKSSAELLSVHVDHIISTSTNPDPTLPIQILGVVISSVIPWPPSASTNRPRMAVAIENPDLALLVATHASSLSGVKVASSDFRNPDALERVDMLISDSVTYAQHPHLRRWIPRSGKAFLWDQLLKDAVRNDPAFIRHTLGTNLLTRSKTPDHQNGNGNGNGRVSHSIPRGIAGKSRAAPPFRDDHAYCLLGGIGGLGVDLAVWMYQHGARHLVLTSRRGVDSLDPVKDAMALTKVAFLQSQPDLDIRLCKCDATDAAQMDTLLSGLPVPVAGCFLMTLVLSDAPFFKQTADTFHDVYASKLKVFEVFSTLVGIKTLDFFVTLSSISGLVGIPGQTSYASACTALDGVLADYDNAFSLVTPGIFDAGFLDRASINRKDELAIISAEALWTYLEDGLKKLGNGRFNQYIPALDWRIVDRQLTLPTAYRQLLSPNSRRGEDSAPTEHNAEAILARVLELLEVSLADFDAAQPLSIYGLDSISAAKLSSILRPYASFSPVQLLGGATWSEIESDLQYSGDTGTLPLGDGSAAKAILLDILGTSPDDFSPDIPLSSYGLDSLGASRLATALRLYMAVTQMQLMGQTTWTELLELAQRPAESSPDLGAQPLVEICSGPGIPLIGLPGGNGSMGLFWGLRNHFKGSLWAVQVTDSTPLESLEALVAYWKEQICAKWPHGPYRFAAYSGSTLLSIALTKLLEDAGEEVLDLTFIDHCPALWTSEDSEAILREKTAAEFCEFSEESLLHLLRIDATGADALVSYDAAIRGLPNAPPTTVAEVGVLRAVMTLLFNFLQQLYPCDREKSHENFIGPYTAWMSSVQAPLTVLVAEHGFVHRNSSPGWSDLGARRFIQPVKVHYFSDVGHFGLFKDARVAQILDN
ncbi:hypothetical protein C8R47DRAFT_1312711 [Mycena vitilis]|nr:hypothetical protein C8R47DRAFT_1312711 [Mycena vitilis]